MLVPSLSPFPVISKIQITLSCFCIHSASECEGKGQKFHVFFTLVRNFSTISPSSFVVRFCRKLQMNILVCLSFNNNRRVLARAAVMNEGRKKFFTFLANSLSFLPRRGWLPNKHKHESSSQPWCWTGKSFSFFGSSVLGVRREEIFSFYFHSTWMKIYD